MATTARPRQRHRAGRPLKRMRVPLEHEMRRPFEVPEQRIVVCVRKRLQDAGLTQQRIEVAERFGRDVLEDEQLAHERICRRAPGGGGASLSGWLHSGVIAPGRNAPRC